MLVARIQRLAPSERWLTAQPTATDLATLQQQLNQFRTLYNDERVHRAHGQTPAQAYPATLKAAAPTPPPHNSGPYRLRLDHVDRNGKISLRRAGRMHHLGVGTAHAATQVYLLIHPDTVEIINPATGQLLSRHTIDPTRSYWRNNQKSPGRWPGLSSS